MDYVSIEEAIQPAGLRLVLLRGMPSPWGQAAKAMMEYKALPFRVAAQEPGGANEALVDWAGTNSAPVVAWEHEAPINRWNDILLLLERLAPERPLLPEAPAERIEAMGWAHEICGELGLGWNCRLNMVRPPPGKQPAEFAVKYGYNDRDGDQAGTRVIGFLKLLAEQLQRQKAAGSDFILGDQITAVDFYWAAFSNLVAIQGPEQCPLDPAVRPRFERVPEDIKAAIDPIVLDHRERIFARYFVQPMEF